MIEGESVRQRNYTWPRDGNCRVPFWVYTDPGVYELEQELIFRGSTWNYVGLEAEIPNPGDFKTTYIGDTSIIVVRDGDDSINALVNKCGHRGARVCRTASGNATDFTCLYHQRNYDLKGNLLGVPFRRGAVERGRRLGGEPEDFERADRGLRLRQLRLHTGVGFASLEPHIVTFREYLGEKMLYYFERVFDGRKLRLLGRSRQKIASNWKLVFENITDPYHATLLHVFLVSFGLFRADQKSKV